MKAINFFTLLIFILLQYVSSQGHSGRITVTGGSGTRLEQHPQRNPSRVDIGAQSDNSDHDLLIHIQHKSKHNKLSHEEREQAEHVTTAAEAQSKPKRHVCRRQIDEMITAKKERNIMAIHVAGLELELRKLQEQNQMLHEQLSSLTIESNFMQTPIEVPIIIDHREHTPNTFDIEMTKKKEAESLHVQNTVKSRLKNSVLIQPPSAQESTGNVGEQKDAASTDETEDINVSSNDDATQTSKVTKEKWSNWYILMFIILLLIPLLIGACFCCLSQQNEAHDAEDHRTTFIVGDAGIQETHTPNGKDLPFTLHKEAFPADDPRYSKESTHDDIQRFSDTMNGYLGNSSKPSIPSESAQIENVPEQSNVNQATSRLSLVDQQVASGDET